MKFWFVALLLTVLSTGCTNLSLERNTLKQSESLSDLRYKEVLYNFAALAENPAVLPTYASIFAGTTSLSDSGTITPASIVGREGVGKAGATITHFEQGSVDVLGMRKVSDNWSLDPVAVPEKIEAMRLASLCVMEAPEVIHLKSGVFLERYGKCMPPGHYFDVAQDLGNLPTGWLHIGCLKDVPLKAAYKAHCGSTWVWVCDDGMAGLTAFTLVIQKIARVATDDTYNPKLSVQTITRQAVVGADTVQVTVYADPKGNLVSASDTPLFKKRLDDTGTNAFTRSVIAAAGSKTP